MAWAGRPGLAAFDDQVTLDAIEAARRRPKA
jgi:hypothetical protein